MVYDISACVYVSTKLRIASVYAHSCTAAAFLNLQTYQKITEKMTIRTTSTSFAFSLKTLSENII